MKNIVKIISIAFSVMALSFFVSCDTEETKKTDDGKFLEIEQQMKMKREQMKKDLAPVLIQKREPANMTLEQVVNELDELAIQEDRVIKATILFNRETEKYGYEDVFVYKNKDKSDFMKGALRAFRASYQVDCYYSDFDYHTTTYCDDFDCVADAVFVCTQGNGCATTCPVSYMMVTPKIKEQPTDKIK